MKPQVSRRASAVPKSVTSVEQTSPDNEGDEVIDLAQGEADDLYPPESVKEAAHRAIQDNRTKYTPTGGIPELKEAIALRFARDNGLRVNPSQVMASTGAKQCIFNFMLAALNPGEEVLVPSPYWVSFPRQVELVGGRPVIVPTSVKTGFKVTGDQLRSHLTPKTRALVLNNPNNPSGAVYTRAELLDILSVALSAKLVVLADEVYDCMTYDGVEHVTFASLSPEAAEMTVTVNAVSKSYCMTGWRLGFATGPEELIAAMERIQSHSTSCPNVVAQWAAVEALTGDQGPVASLKSELDARRRFVLKAFKEMPGLECSPLQGGFFAFPSISSYQNGSEFAQALLKATGVMVVPGEAFGLNNHVRICFAASRASLELGMEKMTSWLQSGTSNTV